MSKRPVPVTFSGGPIDGRCELVYAMGKEIVVPVILENGHVCYARYTYKDAAPKFATFNRYECEDHKGKTP